MPRSGMVQSHAPTTQDCRRSVRLYSRSSVKPRATSLRPRQYRWPNTGFGQCAPPHAKQPCRNRYRHVSARPAWARVRLSRSCYVQRTQTAQRRAMVPPSQRPSPPRSQRLHTLTGTSGSRHGCHTTKNAPLDPATGSRDMPTRNRFPGSFRTRRMHFETPHGGTQNARSAVSSVPLRKIAADSHRPDPSSISNHADAG